MGSLIRLFGFTMLSLLLHLLVIQIEIAKQSGPKAVRGQEVGFVSRSVGQFVLSKPALEPASSIPTRRVIQPESIEREISPSKPVPLRNHQMEKPEQFVEVVSRPPAKEPAINKAVSQKSEVINLPDKAEKSFEQTIEKPVPPDFHSQKNSPEKQSKANVSHDSGMLPIKQATVGEEVMGDVDNAAGSEELRSFFKALPRYDVNPLPKYPELARRRGQQGTVKFEVLVLVDGSVGDIEMIESSGYRSLDKAAKKAVKYWRFNPARSFSTPVESRVVIPVDFVLN